MTNKYEIMDAITKLSKEDQKYILTNLRELRNSQEGLRIGQTVSFDYNGETLTGEVKKLMPKNVKVIVDGYKEWRVHPSFLTVV
tara:strand:+ start:1669 stop:1920 length:252 start_codon:yes stop_codon:yes gene_type:complete